MQKDTIIWKGAGDVKEDYAGYWCDAKETLTDANRACGARERKAIVRSHTHGGNT
jgi:hypothetical protein